jgi:ribose transport system substrate-binding protein
LDNANRAGVLSCRIFEKAGAGPKPGAAAEIVEVSAGRHKMKPIKTFALAMLALGVTMTVGCDRHSTKEVFYLISANQALPYWQTAAAGFKQAAAQFKVTARVDGPDGYDPQAEAAELQKAIAAKPAGILISVADAAVLQPQIDAAVSAGIPVITVDSDAAGSRRLYFIGTNNLEAGQLGGRRVIEKLGGKGNVVFFTLAGQSNTDERLKGFKDVFSTRPDIKIVDVVDIKSDPKGAFDKTQQYLALTGDKKINAFVCLDSASGKPVSDAVARSNGGGQIVVAWDVNQDTLDGIKAGTIDSTIAQKPYTMGYAGLKALDDVFHYPPAQLTKDYSADSFAPYPVFVDTGTSLVDKSNVDLYMASAAAGSK